MPDDTLPPGPDPAAGATALEMLVGRVADEYRERLARGERPDVEEYARRHPECAGAIRPVLRALVALNEPPTLAAAPAPHGEAPPPALGDYRIVRELGRGGMGVVYQALHLKLHRPVALKMILAGTHAGPQELARFRAEAEAVARLQHPNIVQIYEVGEHDGLPYFALEFVDGGSLAEKLDGTPWPGRQAARLVEDLARAMDYAHRRGVIHRDLKPGRG